MNVLLHRWGGEQALTAGAAYSPLGGSPQSLAVAFAALSRRSDGKLPLIPSGTLTMRTVTELEVARDAEIRKVQLVMLTGIP